ncbi:MAG: S8 family serine peptidase [Lewinellaceae bacterium]|nr:S8 family serine peptidase [Lewinellaceae bacterium]
MFNLVPPTAKTLLTFLFFFPLCAIAQNSKIDPELLQRMTAAPEVYQEIIIGLTDQEDTRAMLAAFEAGHTPLDERSYQVISRLQTRAAATQPIVIGRLQQLDGADASSIYPVWITNAIFVRANAAAIVRMADWPEVGDILWNAPVEIILPVHKEVAAAGPNGKESGLSAIKAPFMWDLGYTGYGRKALVIDTGNDADHPAMVDNFWGHRVPIQQAWNGSKYPEDCAEHGTHVTGTVCGLDRKTNDTIGVAFNAHWMGGPMQFPVGSDLGCASSFNQTVFANTVTMQWAINPDGNAATTADQPDVINCSWRAQPFSCGVSQAINVLNAVEAAGIAVVWAQGNEGPDAGTVSSGASMNMDLVNTFAVGAVDGANSNFPIADFSSRGPSPCGGAGALLIKPEVCAPGVAVRSAVPGTGYMAFNGTSMAAPHAAGAIVLLREAFPYLSGIQLKLALYNSATDLGTFGEDNAHGKGMINLQAAYNYLILQGNSPVPPVSADRDALTIDVQVAGRCKGPVVATVTFENAGAETINSLQIQYGIEGGTQQNYNWTGTLAPNAFTTVTLPDVTGITPGDRTFVVELFNPNSQPDSRPLNNRFKRAFTMANADYPTAAVSSLQPQPLCSGGRVLLEYTGTLGPQDKAQWFSTQVAVNPVAETSRYLTPPLSQSTNYYVSTSGVYKVGRFDLSAGTNTGSGIEGGLVFNATQAFVLKTVKVFADQTGARLIRIEDKDGNLVASKPVIISQTGEQRVTLNINIPKGDGFRIIAVSGNPLKHSVGASGYPYTVSGVVSIYTGRTPGGGNSTLFYYYFFDWEVEVPSVCGRIAVPVQVSPQMAPAVSFTTSADTTYLSGGGNIAFSDQTAGAVSRSWDFGNGQTSTEATPSATYTQTGAYLVRLISATANGCSNVAEKTITVLQTSSARELPGNAADNVALFPNPATDEVLLAFVDERAPANVDIRVSDLLGRNVRTLNHAARSADGLLRVDVATLPPGVYAVLLHTDGRPYWSGKFVKK